MRMRRKLLWMLTAVLVAALGLPATAIAADMPFTDVPAGAWYYADVKAAYEGRLIDGRSATRYAPDENMTYAEAVKLAACMDQQKKEGKVTLTSGTPWYKPYVDYAKLHKLIPGDLNWESKATRAGYMQIFAQVLPDEKTPKNKIVDGSIPDVPSSHTNAAAIYELYRAGVVVGVDAAHNCNPGSNIKRSEVAAILTRMMNADKRISFTLEGMAGMLIIQQPTDQKAAEGSDATFTLVAKGTGLTYQWQRGEATMLFETASNVADSGLVGVNAGSTGILTLPSTDLLNPDIKPDLELSVQFRIPKIETTWIDLADGSEVVGARADKLTVKASPRALRHNGYRCIVKDKEGRTETSVEAALISTSPGIKITQQPVEQRVKAGEWANLQIQATGSGLTYQWEQKVIGGGHKVGFVDMKDAADVQGAATPNLKVTAKATGALSLGLGPTQEYRCVVKDRYGQIMATQSARVSGFNIIKITQQPVSVSEWEGGTAELNVKAEGDWPLTYRWQIYFAGAWKDLPETHARFKGAHTSTLKILLGASEVPDYRCVVSEPNSSPVTSAQAKVTVKPLTEDAIAIEGPFDATDCRVATRAWFQVKVKSLANQPVQSYQWQKRSGGDWNNMQDGSEAEGTTTATMGTWVPENSWNTKYRCIVKVGGKEYTSGEAGIKQRLVVVSKPDIGMTFTTTGKKEFSTYKCVTQGDLVRCTWRTGSNEKDPVVPDVNITRVKGSKICMYARLVGDSISMMRYMEYTPTTDRLPLVIVRNYNNVHCHITDLYGNKIVVGPYKIEQEPEALYY